jgi:hypothetical protein
MQKGAFPKQVRHLGTVTVIYQITYGNVLDRA